MKRMNLPRILIVAALMGGATVGTSALAGTGDWSLYSDYAFRNDSNEVLHPQGGMADEIASYMGQDPSRQVGLDGFNDENVVAVRDALLSAGVPAARIRVGAFGNPQLRHEGRVAVLFRN